MDNETLKQQIDVLIAQLGDEAIIARPALEREVVEKTRLILDATRDQRTGSARDTWEYYLPYAVHHCQRLAKLAEGWEDDLDYFASENAQFWLDNANAFLEKGDITGVKKALGQIGTAARLMKRDRVAQVDILLQALDIALELNDKKLSIQLYEQAEKLYRNYLADGSEYTGSAWVPKIKRMGQQLTRARDNLNRYYKYAETVTVSLEADSSRDLERVIDHLQQNLPGKVTVTRQIKEVGDQGSQGANRFRVRLKITLY